MGFFQAEVPSVPLSIGLLMTHMAPVIYVRCVIDQFAYVIEGPGPVMFWTPSRSDGYAAGQKFPHLRLFKPIRNL